MLCKNPGQLQFLFQLAVLLFQLSQPLLQLSHPLLHHHELLLLLQSGPARSLVVLVPFEPVRSSLCLLRHLELKYLLRLNAVVSQSGRCITITAG